MARAYIHSPVTILVQIPKALKIGQIEFLTVIGSRWQYRGIVPNMKKAKENPKFIPRIRGLQLTEIDQAHLSRLQQKFPEQNITTLIRRAIRELAEREQVA